MRRSIISAVTVMVLAIPLVVVPAPQDPAAVAAIDLVQSTIRDTAYVGLRVHAGLFNNLTSLERAAWAVSDIASGDDGKDWTALAAKVTTFRDALRNAETNANEIGNRAGESAESKAKSRQLAMKLQVITRQLISTTPSSAAAEYAARQPVGVESKASEKDGLSVVIQSYKDTFVSGEPLALKVTYRNATTGTFRLPDQVNPAHYGLWSLKLENVDTGKIYTGATTRPSGALPEPGEINPAVLRAGVPQSVPVVFEAFGFVEGAMDGAAAKTALFNLQVAGGVVGRGATSMPARFSPDPGTYRVRVSIQFVTFPDTPRMSDDVRAAKAAIENDPIPMWKGGKVMESNPVEIKIAKANP